VWRALTGDAARLAGVDARVGLIERGRDADLVAWSGDPLNLTSRVRAVYVAGKLVFRGEETR
jgi:imidazolonepropionase-like amidohydrolase